MNSTMSQIHSTLDRAVKSLSRFQQHEVEVETVVTIVKEVIVRLSWECNVDLSGKVVQGCVPRRSTVSVQVGNQHEQGD